MKKLIIVAAGVALVSCSSFRNLDHDLDYVEGLGTVDIDVTVESWNGAPIIVWAVEPPTPRGSTYSVARQRTLSEPSSLQLMLEPGTYVLAAVEDTNRNGDVDDEERGVIVPGVEVAAGEERTGQNLVISEVLQPPPEYSQQAINHDFLVVGDQVSLEDERFTYEVARMGLWQPYTFLGEHGIGVYMLEPYDPDRTPVIFVHGMTGFPQQFSHIIEGMDRSRFQPWVFHYPSGARLQELARIFSQIVTALQAQHDFERHCVVAHSMGGLLSWAYLNEHFDNNSRPTARGLVTIASPLGGMPSASLGVRFSPEVVPAWRDISPDSDFLESLFTRQPPDDFEYHLLFTWQDDGSDDGTVPLPSQIRAVAQERATLVRGFEASHAGCLEDDAVRAQVLSGLDRCRGLVSAVESTDSDHE